MTVKPWSVLIVNQQMLKTAMESNSIGTPEPEEWLEDEEELARLCGLR